MISLEFNYGFFCKGDHGYRILIVVFGILFCLHGEGYAHGITLLFGTGYSLARSENPDPSVPLQY
jgi:hypothetical protein